MADTIVTNDSDTIKETATMAYTPGYALPLPAESDNYDVEIVNEVTEKVDAALSMLKENKMHHVGNRIDTYTTILDAVNACKVDSSFFANQSSTLVDAVDRPPVLREYQYLVLMDDQQRKTVLAFTYGVGSTHNTFFMRCIYGGKWLNEWTPIATATPPQEYPLPINLTIGHPTDAKNKYRKNAFEETTIFASIASVGNAFTDGPIILAALPDDVKPSDYIRTPAVIFKTSGTISSGFVVAQPNGEIVTAVTPDTNRIEFQMML